MKLKAKNSIYGLKRNPQEPTLAGEYFELDDEDQAWELIAAGAAEEMIQEEEGANSPRADTDPDPDH